MTPQETLRRRNPKRRPRSVGHGEGRQFHEGPVRSTRRTAMDRRLLGRTLLVTWALMAQAAGLVRRRSLKSHLPTCRNGRSSRRPRCTWSSSSRVGSCWRKMRRRRLPPASLTKIMTALVALESAPLQEVVKIDDRAIVHHSAYNFRPGEEFLLRDLVTAMLVASANDACEAVAWHIGGDDKRFVVDDERASAHAGVEEHAFRQPLRFRCAGALFDGRRSRQTDRAGAATADFFP